MKITQVAVRPTDASVEAGRPALTPELLAATGARYSRSNNGLEAILHKIDPANLDKSVDSIFRMIDYGHQSIADMVPVAMFIDSVSIWLAYYVWTLCPTAGGQESSTRYIRLSADELPSPEQFGIPPATRTLWDAVMHQCFDAYNDALEVWTAVAAADPSVLRIPRELSDDVSDKARKQVQRMRRNYAFDRARYFLPASASTNMMLIMSARGWVQLCQTLLSHPLKEARQLGEGIRAELMLAAPRMLAHACSKHYLESGLAKEFSDLRGLAQRESSPFLRKDSESFEHPCTALLTVHPPADGAADSFHSDLRFHENRYAYTGPSLQRTAVRFGWQAVAFAEIRDLNRHRTGAKYCPMLPLGFYSALDAMPKPLTTSNLFVRLRGLSEIGRESCSLAREELVKGDPTYVYWTLLGSQFAFEHLTTGDKFIYEAELRTGIGAHFRYARHLRESLGLWYQRFPKTRGLILEGSAEPE